MRENVLLRDTGVAVDPTDGRNIEIVATGLPTEHGIPVAVDATMVSPLHANGLLFAGADARPGVALARGERSKQSTYPELTSSPQLRLLTAGIEVGGRMNRSALKLLADLATARAESEPRILRSIIARAFRARWTTMVSLAAQDALAATLVNDGVAFLDTPVDGSPLAVDLWLDDARV